MLQLTAFGRKVYFIGSNRDVPEYSGIEVRKVKAWLFTMSELISALAGLLYAARVRAVRGDVALGFELDIFTIVLLGGVSIFGGTGTITGTITGTLLAILIVLNVRNGMALANITGHLQTGGLGILLILSMMVPNFQRAASRAFKRISGGEP